MTKIALIAALPLMVLASNASAAVSTVVNDGGEVSSPQECSKTNQALKYAASVCEMRDARSYLRKRRY